MADDLTSDDVASDGPAVREIEVSLPFRGRWLTQNSPARRVPSHGVDVLGERYAVDFVGVDERHRTAGTRDWRTLLATEPPERFVAFGRPLLAPVSGTVGSVHDGEPDHEARRSQVSLVPYALGQAGRLRRGVAAVAGNHVTIALPGDRGFVALAHCRPDRSASPSPSGGRGRADGTLVRDGGVPGEGAVVEPL